MRRFRLYVNTPLSANTAFTLSGDRAHYLGKVLRATPGTELCLFNDSGLEYAATVSALNKQEVEVLVREASDPGTESPLRTLLALGISRGERMDYAIQKSTELGVSRIQPLFTTHCEVKLDGSRQDKRIEHWRQVAISACEQSGRVKVPEVLPPLPLAQFLERCDAALKLLFDQGENAKLNGPAPAGEVALLIGPEGGLAPEELTLARRHGFVGIQLGPRILRTETAPVAALALLQWLWG
ncbi:MAG: 16S rRNA (uracil(1498)-N(3))-methyltransferase [Pseudomonadales bacterium]|jgi:16S rRNA (uracil1498-N3)-methyltransferase|nr:16S rRNA (uracil(1498)-N(3))-methyltransferase [Pseudomonadales bacterium]